MRIVVLFGIVHLLLMMATDITVLLPIDTLTFVVVSSSMTTPAATIAEVATSNKPAAIALSHARYKVLFVAVPILAIATPSAIL